MNTSSTEGADGVTARPKIGTMTTAGKEVWRTFLSECESAETLVDVLVLEFTGRKTNETATLTIPKGAKVTRFEHGGTPQMSKKIPHTQATVEWSGGSAAVKSDGSLWYDGSEEALRS